MNIERQAFVAWLAAKVSGIEAKIDVRDAVQWEAFSRWWAQHPTLAICSPQKACLAAWVEAGGSGPAFAAWWASLRC